MFRSSGNCYFFGNTDHYPNQSLLVTVKLNFIFFIKYLDDGTFLTASKKVTYTFSVKGTDNIDGPFIFQQIL